MKHLLGFSRTAFVATALCVTAAGCGDPDQPPADVLDDELQMLIDEQQLTPLEPLPQPRQELVALGQALFFDKEMSGNRDIACATCHHPNHGTGDGLRLSIGTGGMGLGDIREQGEGRELVPRHAPDLFNRGYPELTGMFWDSRIAVTPDGFSTPAGAALRSELLDSVLAAQAMFPVTSRDEMRGAMGDMGATGVANELATYANDDFAGIWSGIVARILAISEYQTMFQSAYPGVALEDFRFEHIGNAIAAFEIDAYTITESSWDLYLRGNKEALSDAGKRGALLFFGEARCNDCHSGPTLSDGEHHVIGVPQFGPGKAPNNPDDHGRARVTQVDVDRFAFKSPPLRNVAQHGPWTHSGAYTTLEAVVRHHLDPATALRNYDFESELPLELADTYRGETALIDDIISRLDSKISTPIQLDDDQVADLVAFLEALTDPQKVDLSSTIPASVPSGIPVER